MVFITEFEINENEQRQVENDNYISFFQLDFNKRKSNILFRKGSRDLDHYQKIKNIILEIEILLNIKYPICINNFFFLENTRCSFKYKNNELTFNENFFYKENKWIYLFSDLDVLNYNTSKSNSFEIVKFKYEEIFIIN